MILYSNNVNWSVFDGEITLAKEARNELWATVFSEDPANRSIVLVIAGQRHAANLMNVPSSSSVQISYGKAVQEEFKRIFRFSFDYYTVLRAEARRLQLSTRRLPFQELETITIRETDEPLVYEVACRSHYTPEDPYVRERRDTEESLLFPEGRQVWRRHIAYERNQGLVALAKALFKEAHGALYCEVCGFSFSVYGSRGADYIEAHHDAVPVSELGEEAVSRVEDLRMVCANCHRMLHLRRPWLKVEELQTLLAEASV